MPYLAQIQGGPRDGEIVPYQGPFLRLPVSRPFRGFVTDPAYLPPESTYFIDDYQVRRGFDGELYYVRLKTGR